MSRFLGNHSSPEWGKENPGRKRILILGGGPQWTNQEQLLQAFRSDGHDCRMGSWHDWEKKKVSKKFTPYIYRAKHMARGSFMDDADGIIVSPSQYLTKIDLSAEQKAKTIVILSSSHDKNSAAVKVRGKYKAVLALPYILGANSKRVPELMMYFPPGEYPQIDKTKSGYGKIKIGNCSGKGLDFGEAVSYSPPEKGVMFWDHMAHKAKCDVFLAQMRKRSGILGKAAFEAMALDCIVMGDSKKDHFKPNKFYPEPFPVLDTTDKPWTEYIKEFVEDPKRKEDYYLKVKAWRQRYMSYRNVVDYFFWIWDMPNEYWSQMDLLDFKELEKRSRDMEKREEWRQSILTQSSFDFKINLKKGIKVCLQSGGPRWTGSDHLARAFHSEGVPVVAVYGEKLDQPGNRGRLQKEDEAYSHYVKDKKSHGALMNGCNRFIHIPSNHRYTRREDPKSIAVITASSCSGRQLGSIPLAIPFWYEEGKGDYIYYSPCEFPEIDKVKDTGVITIAHCLTGVAHNNKVKKRSNQIRHAVHTIQNKYGEDKINYVEIASKDYWDGIKMKAKSHIAIEHLNSKLGSGKTTWESIALNCVTISCLSRDTMGTNEFYPEPPPIIHVGNEKELVTALEKLIDNPEYLREEQEKVKKWSYFISYRNTVDYFLWLWENNWIEGEAKVDEVILTPRQTTKQREKKVEQVGEEITLVDYPEWGDRNLEEERNGRWYCLKEEKEVTKDECKKNTNMHCKTLHTRGLKCVYYKYWRKDVKPWEVKGE